jgi:hypothetical protein
LQARKALEIIANAASGILGLLHTCFLGGGNLILHWYALRAREARANTTNGEPNILGLLHTCCLGGGNIILY